MYWALPWLSQLFIFTKKKAIAELTVMCAWITIRGLRFGGVPEWPKGSDCKSDGSAFGGSNPPPSTTLGRYAETDWGRSQFCIQGLKGCGRDGNSDSDPDLFPETAGVVQR